MINMKKIWFFLCLLPAIFGTLSAQKLKTNTYQVGIGGSFVNFSELNSAFKTLGNKSVLDGKMTNVTVDYAHFHNRFMWGIDGAFITKIASRGFNNRNNFDAYNQFATGMLKIGYSPVVWDDTYFFYPTLGVGGGYANLKRIDKSDTLKLSIASHTTFGALAEAALNVMIITPMPDSDDTNACIGLTIGYQFAPKMGNMWQINTLLPEKNVQMSPQGVFFRISLGMGYGR